jgi:hypothetical protein
LPRLSIARTTYGGRDCSVLCSVWLGITARIRGVGSSQLHTAVASRGNICCTLAKLRRSAAIIDAASSARTGGNHAPCADTFRRHSWSHNRACGSRQTRITVATFWKAAIFAMATCQNQTKIFSPDVVIDACTDLIGIREDAAKIGNLQDLRDAFVFRAFVPQQNCANCVMGIQEAVAPEPRHRSKLTLQKVPA